MSKVQLTDGSPVPEDRSHTEIDPKTGQQKGYVVLTPEVRAKGFVKPVRKSYIHQKCGTLTSMGRSLAETYARNPRFYSGTFCVGCSAHFNLDEFSWEDGEPMDPDQQDTWFAAQAEIKLGLERALAEKIEQTERAELARLKAKYECSACDAKED
jgi:hypothetical protein